jgi:hypothetical protein
MNDLTVGDAGTVRTEGISLARFLPHLDKRVGDDCVWRGRYPNFHVYEGSKERSAV